MKKYTVRITATVVKDITVDAPDEDTANDMAHERFSVLCDNDEEHYTQDTVSINAI